jgi:spoIIIJ-associated protein
MTPTRRFFSAPSLTQALLTAARHYEVEPEALDYRLVDRKHGFLKKPRGVVIEIDPERPTRAAAPDHTAAAPASEAAPPSGEVAAPVAEPLPQPPPAAVTAQESVPAEPVELAQPDAPAEPDEPAESQQPEAAGAPPPAVAASDGEPADEETHRAVAQAVDELAQLAGLRVQAAGVLSTEDGMAIELEGPDDAKVTAHGGRALLAMQHLLPRLLFTELGRSVHCRLDCGGFHAARGERLARLALKAAERVRRGGRSWLLEPMPPDERRLVHLALAEEPGIETESVGEGFLKRVRVAAQADGA